MEPCPYFENGIAVFASITFCSRAWWSSRCSCSQAGTCPPPYIWVCSLVGPVFNLSVMVQYLSDYPTFYSTAHYWTDTFAKGASLGIEEKVKNVFFFCNLLVHWESGLVHAEAEILFTFSDQIFQDCWISLLHTGTEVGGDGFSWKFCEGNFGNGWWGWEHGSGKALFWLKIQSIVYVLSFEAGVIFTWPLIP